MAKPAAKRNLKFRRPPAPTFVKLASGGTLEGVFLGQEETEFGPAYRFRVEDGKGGTRQVILGGNRAQLDRLMRDEIANVAEDYPDGSPLGHYLVLIREEDVVSRQGRNVGQYAVAHDYERCPKKCVPI